MFARSALAGLVLTLTVLGPVSSLAGQDEFCNGYYKGYLEGYKWASGSIIEPSIPLCPLQPRKTVRDPDDDFEHGYEVGYDQGREAGRRRYR